MVDLKGGKLRAASQTFKNFNFEFIDINNSFIDINKDGHLRHIFLISIIHLLISIIQLLISIKMA